MEKYKCPVCNQMIYKHVKETHDIYCLNSIKKEEYENLIPCEMCNEFIEFDKYSDHSKICIPHINQPIFYLPYPSDNYNPSLLTNLINNINNDVAPSGQDEAPAQEEIVNNEFYIPNLIDANNIEEPDNPIDDLLNLLNNFQNNNSDILNNENNYEYLTQLGEQIGNVNINIDDINKYCVIKSEKIECPICSQSCDLVRETKCNHKFCLSCIDVWTKENNTCPICMKELESID